MGVTHRSQLGVIPLGGIPEGNLATALPSLRRGQGLLFSEVYEDSQASKNWFYLVDSEAG
jgi:hypothetical protein